MVESVKWIDDIVKLHRIKLIPLEEFDAKSDDNKISHWKETGKRVLFKNVRNNVIIDNETKNAFLRELKLHLRRDCNERIIQIFGITQGPTTDSLVFVIQYADGGNLRHHSKNFTKLSWIDKLSLSLQISEGINFLHANGIMHGNLNPWNIVVHQNRAKLVNFGILKLLKTTSPTHDDFSIKNIPYIEPQFLLDQSYKKDARSDIYSFGVIMWEISSGKPPYNSDNNKDDLISKILQSKREKIVKDTPKTYADLYAECWRNDSNKRPTIGIILNQLKNLLNVMKTDKELKEMEIDALTAELWLEVKKEPTQTTTPADTKTKDIKVEKETKSKEVKVIASEPDLRQPIKPRKSWKSKAKNRAKGFVRRFSGSTITTLSDLSSPKKSFTSVESEDKDIIDQKERLGTGWTLINSDDGMMNEPESPITPKSESLHKGFFNLSSLTGRSASESSMNKSLLGVPDKFQYSEHCKMLFISSNWTLNSAPCYAAYHVRQGDLDGLKWHVQVQGEGLNDVQQVTGPRNSYRRPLEALMIEAAQYCPGEKIIETFTTLQSLGATCDCINSYTGGTPINYLGENKSLFSSETDSQHFKDSIKYLISRGCLINTRKQNGDTLLITILFKWYRELTPNAINYCLNHGANPDTSNEIGGNPLGYTLTQIRFNYDGGPFEKIYKILKLLVKHGADVNKQITIPGKKLPNLLFVCVDMGMNMKEEWIKKLIKRLIKWGVNVNAKMGQGIQSDDEEFIDEGILLAGSSKNKKSRVKFNLTEDQRGKEKIKNLQKEEFNVLGYAAKLSQLATIKILLDRIYSLSSPESIKEALNFTSKAEVEQRKCLKSWLDENKREKIKSRMERREMKRREKLKKRVKMGKQVELYEDDDDDDDDDHDHGYDRDHDRDDDYDEDE